MNEAYDCAIIGGGLAGLSLAIQLAAENRKVILFEKENYPFHKVCGEYISSESTGFLERLGIRLGEMDIPYITELLLTSPYGIQVKVPLDVCGIGISRYKLDEMLYRIALDKGAEVKINTRVMKVEFQDDLHKIAFEGGNITARTVSGAYGKNSNIDRQFGRNFVARNDSELFIAVKHQVRVPFNKNTVEMHNFPGGYCGMSAIEDDKINLSYITKIINLKESDNSIPAMEKKVLSVNPYLKKYFSTAEFLFEKPLVISHLCFGLKNTVDEHIIMLGDAAGNIAPLSGNGMSIALRSSLLAFQAINSFLDNKLSRTEMEQSYKLNWHEAFSKRINIARFINHSFGKSGLTDFNFLIFKVFPFLISSMSKQIHGPAF
jgi:flavin-dependent dehydrogenase